VASLDFCAFKLTQKMLEYAAAFFILGDSLKDAVNVCLRHLDDIQLAVALARVIEGRDDGPVLCSVLYENIIPLAFKKGNRWLGSWAFWLLHRRDLAVRILVVSGPVVLLSVSLSDRRLLDTFAGRC
jgi:RAVE protein 1 C terminal